MEAGRQLDKLIADKLGWTEAVPNYSKDLMSAWTLVQYIPRFNIRRTPDNKWEIILVRKKERHLEVIDKPAAKIRIPLPKFVEADTAPHVICLAYLTINS